jgi:hypothetical protein
MAVTILPNSEALLSRFLRDDVDVAALVADRVYTTMPKGHNAWPAVRLTRFGGTPPFQAPLVLDKPQIQVDAWGGSKAIAREVAETIRAVCDTRLPGRHPEGIVYAVEFGALLYLPDEVFDPPRPRYLFDLTLTVRAAT